MSHVIPDDGSISWYLHQIIGQKLTAKNCVEISKRLRENYIRKLTH